MKRCPRRDCGGTIYVDQDGVAVCLLCNRSSEAVSTVPYVAERRLPGRPSGTGPRHDYLHRYYLAHRKSKV